MWDETLFVGLLTVFPEKNLDDSLLAPTNQLCASRLVQRELLQLTTRFRALRAQKHRRRSPPQTRQRRRSTPTTAEHCDDGDDCEHVRGETEADTDVDPEPHERQGGRYVSRRIKPGVLRSSRDAFEMRGGVFLWENV